MIAHSKSFVTTVLFKLLTRFRGLNAREFRKNRRRFQDDSPQQNFRNYGVFQAIDTFLVPKCGKRGNILEFTKALKIRESAISSTFVIYVFLYTF